MNRNTLLFAALVLLLLAGPLVWLASVRPSAPRGGGPAAAPPRAPESVGRHRPRGPRATAPPTAPDETAAAEPAPGTTAEPSPPAPPPRAVLRCRIEGLDPDVPPAATVVVVERAGDGRVPSVRFDGGPADHFDVDVSPLLPDDEDSADLAITAERHGYLTASGTATLWAPAAGRTRTVVREVVLRLRVAGWVSGIVQDDRFQRVAGADVGAWIWADVPHCWVPVDTARTGEDGAFRLRLRPDEANLVVVAAAGRAPDSAQVTGVARAETELTPFTLQPGLAISGSLRLADGRPVPDASVVAAPTWAQTDVTLGRNRLAYRAGLIFRSPASAPVAEGLFRVEGLVPGDYDLSVSARGFAPDLLDTARRRASPPLERADLVLDPARVVVQVTADGRPAPRISVPVANANGAVVLETDARGIAAFFVRPRTDYEIDLQPPGFERSRRSFGSPVAGAETTIPIDLRRRAAWPSLVLALAPEEAAGEDALESAEVRLWPADAPPGAPAERAEVAAFDRGVARIDGIFAGTYRAVVVPRGEGFRLPATRRVVLRDGAATRVDLRFPHGGRLHVAVHDAGGRAASAAWRVLADVRDDAYAAGDAGSGDDPLLAPGRYRVVVTPAGGESTTFRATVVTDRTVDVDAVLPAPRKTD